MMMMMRTHYSSSRIFSSVSAACFFFAATMLYNVVVVVLVEASDSAMNEPFSSSSYSSLDHAPCVTLFHRNGRLGCGTASRSSQKGLVQYYDGSSCCHDEPYVIVIEDYMLKADTFDILLASNSIGLLQGILVLNSTSSDGSNNNNKNDVDHRSPDSMYPQGYNTPSQNVNYGYNKYPWNGRGEGLLLYDFYGVPMALAKNADVSATIRQAAQDQTYSSSSNGDTSTKSSNMVVAEFNYYMGQELMTSAECLMWKDVGTNEWSPKCLPLGGTSVWAAAGSPPASSADFSSSSSSSKRPVILVGAGTDSTSLFHDVVPGANTAASSILTTVMAAKMLGDNVNDATLDALNHQIVFSLFAAETYGFVGSRNFIRDVSYPGAFACNSDLVRAVPRQGEKSPMACLNPLYPSVAFSNLGQIAGMIAVDQVGVVTMDNFLYVHADQNNDNFGAFLANVLKSSGTSSFTVVATSAESNNNNGGYPYPPSPLTSLLSLSAGAAGGAVLTGYDYAFTTHSPYHSHMASSSIHGMNYKSIAAAATIVARAALAAAYDAGDGSYDYETASAYALNLIPNELSYQDETLVALGDCLFYNGECDMIKRYATVTSETERTLTGFRLGTGASLGVPPNYYAGVYNGLYGQPYVQVGDNIYGAYDGQDFGKKSADAISLQPRALENAIFGMMNDFLGRGTANFAKKSCQASSDCNDVAFCVNNGDMPTCTGGGVCVCRRAQFHAALDEALVPAKNQYPGMFEMNANDANGYSPMYTEPYWSNSVGVRVYRDAGTLPGLVTLAAGAVVSGLSFCAAFVLRVGLKKEKLY